MDILTLQNFYKDSVKVAWTAGAGNFYVNTKPVPTSGILVVNPSSASKREIIRYSAVGTDGTGDYITVSSVADRGLGGTTAQTHAVDEPIRMNITAEHWDNLQLALDQLETDIAVAVLSGAPFSSQTVAGISRLSTSPNVTLGTVTITIATPAVFTKVAHGLTANDRVRFTTDGTLPTGITAGQDYFVIAAGLTTDEFQISATIGGSAIDTTGYQAGTHTLIRTTPYVVSDNDPRLGEPLTADEKAALTGSQGVPNATNKYVTQDNIYSSEVDQSQTTQNGLYEAGEANATTRKNKIAQSFTAGRTKIRGVTLWKTADLGTFTGTVKVSLQADTAGSPSGTDLVSKTITNTEWLNIAVGEFIAEFTTEYQSLVAGTLYWIVIETSTADNTNHPNLGTNTAGGYANGSLKYNNTTDGWVSVATIDLYFKTLNGVENQIPGTNTVPLVEIFTVSGTYTKKAGLRYIEVEVAGAGGGGGGSGTSSGNGGNGGNSSFGPHCSANGGGFGARKTQGGNGGTATGGDINFSGGKGDSSDGIDNNGYCVGGGVNYFGKSGGNGACPGGSGGSSVGSGSGGGAGGYSRKRILASNLTTTETVTVGVAGAGGTGTGTGTGTGEDGAPGIVIIKEYYF